MPYLAQPGVVPPIPLPFTQVHTLALLKRARESESALPAQVQRVALLGRQVAIRLRYWEAEPRAAEGATARVTGRSRGAEAA
jgi:hypothetical protein